MKKLIGLYGGTFDPPHNAHLSLAKCFLEAFPDAELVVMPCYGPPHKEQSRGGASPAQRLEMAKRCFEKLPRTSVSDMEIKASEMSYTYLTVDKLKTENTQIAIIMGQDNLKIIEKWRKFEYLLRECKIVAVGRGGDGAKQDADAIREKYKADVTVLPMPQSKLSSTEIRRRLFFGDDCSASVPQSVLEYIYDEELYTDMDFTAILTYIDSLSPRRRVHTMNVEKAAWMLCKNHYPSLDKRVVAAAAYLHDCTKERSVEEQFALCAQYGIELDETEQANPKLLHAKTGAAVAKAMFSLPQYAVDAISYHTTARADMTDIEKVLYLADFIECGRTDEFCKDVAHRYYQELQKDEAKAVDKTLLYALKRSIEILKEECKTSHRHTIEARNFLKEQLADENDCRGTDE